MKRIFLAVFIWILFAGILTLYMQQRPGPPAPAEVLAGKQETAAQYRLEVTTSFAAEPDPFALQTGTSPPPALLLRMGSEEILRISRRIKAGIPITVSPLRGILPGDNEIWFAAYPPLENASGTRALRIRIQENARTLADRTFWSEPGGKVSGTIRFTAVREEEHSHAHP